MNANLATLGFLSNCATLGRAASRGAAPEEPIVDFGLLTPGFRSAVDIRARLPFRSSPGLFFIASMSALGGADNLTALPLRSRVGAAFIESIVLLFGRCLKVLGVEEVEEEEAVVVVLVFAAVLGFVLFAVTEETLEADELEEFAILNLNGGFASVGVGGVAVVTVGFRITFMTFFDTSTTKSPPAAISASMLGQSKRSKLNAAKELTTRLKLSSRLIELSVFL